MKIECSKEKLKYFVSLAEKITSKNTTLPILDSILLVAKEKKLHIRATNLNVGVEFEIPATSLEKEGIVAVPGMVLNNTLQLLQQEKTVTLEEKSGNIVISTKNNNITIKTKPYDDFPTLPKIEDGETFTISSKKMIDGIRSVVYSASFSDIKPEIASVFISKEDKNVVFVSTDSFRLAEKKIQIKENGDFEGIILPAKNALEIVRIFSDFDEDIAVTFNKNQISFQGRNIYLTSRLIDGIFPDYKQIIPKSFLTEVVVLRQDLIDGLKMANIFTDKFNKIKIIIDTQKSLFRIEAHNDIGENKTDVSATLSGESVEIMFNAKYIMDCFQSITSDSVVLQFNGEGKPLTIKGVGDNSFTYLVMPIK